ncbi:MAG: hypothetical protein U0931_19425 [Vulcanimicrobiota bacterium]
MIEVLVALILFVLTFLVVLSPLQINQRSAMECSQRLDALSLANDLIEQARALPFEKVGPIEGRRDIYAYRLDVKSEPHLKVVSLLIRWGRDKQLSFGTLIQGESP